jgi:hypothetical protein
VQPVRERHVQAQRPRSGAGSLRSRRGLTFLEVVLAAVLLASVVVVVMTALNFIFGQSERQIARQGAMELANRLMIIFLDDENEFKRQPRSLDFDGRRYNWTSRETNVEVVPAVEGESVTAIKSAERLRNIEVEVWLAAESGGSDRGELGAPSARVVRLVDVIYANPDSVSHLTSTDEGRRSLIERMTPRVGRGRQTPSPSPAPAPRSPGEFTPRPTQPKSGGGK